MTKECASNARNKCGRDKNRAKHESNRNQCASDFRHRLARCVARAQTIFNVMLDRFNNHYRVVNDDTDGENDAEQRRLLIEIRSLSWRRTCD